MKHPIDPKVDCVFKALLGTEENRNLLLHFLNTFLAGELVEPLVSVQILNPYNDKESLNDKLSVVDVKARDDQGRLYQIEVQLNNFNYLPSRILYNWADIYSQQLQGGQSYSDLRPTYAIWLLAENLTTTTDDNYVSHYKMRNDQGQIFNQHGGIWLLELKKFHANAIERDDQRWLKFFKDGEQLNDEALPDWMSTQEMKQAMSTLSTFSEKEHQYHQYQARQEYLRIQRSIQMEQEQSAQALLKERQEKEAALQREKEKDAIIESLTKEKDAEIERLKALLNQQSH